VIYRLVPKQNEPQGNMLIEGLLTYTAGNENMVTEIVEMDVNLGDLSASQKRELLATGRVPQSTRTTPPVQTETRTPVQTETRTPVTTTNMGSASGRTIANTKVLDRGSGVYYRVQLTANLTAFDAKTFYRDLGVVKEVLVEQHDGYYKYTIGPFQTYDQALSYKDQLERVPEIQGAFVVGYRNGNRVSAGSLR
jgi:cell division septation protein DedD